MANAIPAPCRGSDSCTTMNCPLSGVFDENGDFHPVCSKQARTLKRVQAEAERQSD